MVFPSPKRFRYGYVNQTAVPVLHRGVETHIPKLEIAIGDLLKLQTCKFYHRKLILKYSHKYRLGLWRPRADAIKA
ncbi:unnamed protein product [Brassica napus]|uniref:(rape) hypothetical protein n=1 Tax=Brassica napus TaxID=3708 RepID=A0A816XCT0_BRANA|nr:unnamed protein product [Brassica napus]